MVTKENVNGYKYFELTREETQQLHDNDYVVVNDGKFVITRDEEGELQIFETNEVKGSWIIKENYGGRK